MEFESFTQTPPRPGNGKAAQSARFDITAVLFDVDGVIADTASLHTAAWARLAREEGLAFDAEAADALRGLSREDSLLRILDGKRVPKVAFEEMLARKNAYYTALIESLGPGDCLPGVVSLMEEFARLGLRLAAVSLSRNARRVLEQVGIASLLDAIMDGTQQYRSSRGLDRYHLAAAALATSPARCLVIEDSAAGIATAKNAGMKTIGLGDPARLCAADLVFESLRGVRADMLLHWLGCGCRAIARDV